MRRLKRLSPKEISALLGLISLLVVLTFAACSNFGASNVSPDEIRIGYQSVPNAELLTKSLGLAEIKFPEARVKWIPFSSGRSVLLAMADGKVDIGLAGSVPAATAIAQGLPVQVYFIHNIIGDNEALAVTQASKIQSINDLVGKTIGVPFGSTTHFSLLAALSEAGIEASSVRLMDMQPSEILSSWRRGAIDGGFVWQPVLGRLIEEKGRVLLTARQLADSGIVTADLGLVNQQFASQYPDVVAGYVTLLDRAVRRYRGEPGAAARAIAPEVKLSPENSTAVMDQLIWLNAEEQQSEAYMGTAKMPGAISEVLRSSAAFMAAQNAIPPAPELETFEAGLFNQAIEQAVEQMAD